MDSSPIPFPPPPTTVNNNHVVIPAANANAAPNHPPYAEMIYKAIEALKEKDGSSKTAIGKYIEEVYKDLPPAHPTLLTQHLNHLKTAGLLVMVKKSYKLPSFLPPPPPSLPRSQSQSHHSAPLNLTTQSQRDPGGPPKPQIVVLGLADEPAPPTTARRGRPPGTSRSSLPKRPGRPPKPKSVSNGFKRRPGRPPKIQLQPTLIPFAVPPDAPVGSPRPRRGRPRKNAAAPAPPIDPEIRSGRPPKEAKAAIMAQNVADEDLRRKFEHFQSKVKESLNVLKPYFNHESPVTTIAAIQELEILATLDLKTPLRDETQQFQEQLPQQQQLPPPHLPPQQLPQAQMYEHQYLQIPSQPHLQQLFQPHTPASII